MQGEYGPSSEEMGESQQDKKQNVETTKVGATIYDVEQLKEFAESVSETEMPLDSLKEAVSEGNYYWLDRNGKKLGPHQILEDWEAAQQNEAWQDHVGTIKKADLENPIWIMKNGHVFDGVHRLARAFIDGKKSIKVKVFDKLPESAAIGDVENA